MQTIAIQLPDIKKHAQGTYLSVQQKLAYLIFKKYGLNKNALLTEHEMLNSSQLYQISD